MANKIKANYARLMVFSVCYHDIAMVENYILTSCNTRFDTLQRELTNLAVDNKAYICGKDESMNALVYENLINGISNATCISDLKCSLDINIDDTCEQNCTGKSFVWIRFEGLTVL